MILVCVARGLRWHRVDENARTMCGRDVRRAGASFVELSWWPVNYCRSCRRVNP